MLQFTSDHFLRAMVAWNQTTTREFHSPTALRAVMPARATMAGARAAAAGASSASVSASVFSSPLPPQGPQFLFAPEYAHAHVLSLWREMVRRDLPRGERVLTALLRSMSLVGASERAEKLINHMMAGQWRRRDTTAATAPAAAAPTGGMVGPVAGHEARPSALSFAHAYVACMLDGSAAAEARGQRMLQLCHEALKLPIILSSLSSRATSSVAASSFTIDPQAAGQLSDADFLAAQKIYLSVLLPSLRLKHQWTACVEAVERLESVADAMALHRRQRQQQRQQQAAASATAAEGDAATSIAASADEYVPPKLLPALYNQAMECCDVSYQASACVRLMRSLLARQGPAAVELQHYNTLLRAGPCAIGLPHWKCWNTYVRLAAAMCGRPSTHGGRYTGFRAQAAGDHIAAEECRAGPTVAAVIHPPFQSRPQAHLQVTRTPEACATPHA